MKNLFLKFLVLTIPIILACNGFTPEPEIYEPDYTPEINIFGLISNIDEFEFIIVERTLTLEEQNKNWYQSETNQIDTIIKNAIVTINDGTNTIQFNFHKKTMGEYYYYSNYLNKGIYLDTQNRFTAVPGKTYHLRVEIPGRPVITGTAKVPEIPKIQTPKPSSNIPKSSILQTKISWSENTETAAYQLFLIFETKYKNEFGRYNRENVLYEYIVQKPPTKLHYISNFYLNSEYYSDTVTLKVMALDRNYYDYIRSHSGFAEISGNYINTVKGGLGIFGAVAVDSVDIILN